MGDDNRKIAATYILPQQHEMWEEEAESMGMNKSEYIEAMTNAGRKKFDRELEPDKSKEDVIRERDEYYEELKRTRERLVEVEEKSMSGERGVVLEHVAENPGCNFRAIEAKLADTVHERAVKVLDELEGRELYRNEDDEWFVK